MLASCSAMLSPASSPSASTRNGTRRSISDSTRKPTPNAHAKARRDADQLDPDLLEVARRAPGRRRGRRGGRRPASPRSRRRDGPARRRPRRRSACARARASTSRMTTAATPPIRAAFHGLMMCAEAVMATSPASEAFMIVTTSGRRSSRHVSAIPTRPPNAGGERRVQDHRRDVGGQSERAAAVESVPADPQDEHAERGQRQVVGRGSGRPRAEAPDPGPEDDDRGERDPASDRVHDGRAGEVDEPQFAQPTVRAAAGRGSRHPRPSGRRPGT